MLQVNRVENPVCRNPKEPLSLGNRGYCIPTRVLLTFHSSSNAESWERWTMTRRRFLPLILKPETRQHLPDALRRAWRLWAAPVCLRAGGSAPTVAPPGPPLVCGASLPNHMQPCGFPGWLCANPSCSHTFPHTQASHTRAIAIKARPAAGRHCSFSPKCQHTHLKSRTQSGEGRMFM